MATEKQTGTEIDARIGSCFDGPNNLIAGEDCERVWNLGLKKLLSIQSLMSSCGNLENRSAERNANNGGLAYEVSNGSKNSV